MIERLKKLVAFCCLLVIVPLFLAVLCTNAWAEFHASIIETHAWWAVPVMWWSGTLRIAAWAAWKLFR